MIIMSVDLGKARTGIAVSDSGDSFAFPSCVITENTEDKLDQKIAEKAKELGAELIVAGLPKNMDGSEGFRAEECRETAQKIALKSDIEVVMWDERCTTVSAHTVLNMNDRRGKKRKETVDAVAAVMILEDYLAFKRNQKK